MVSESTLSATTRRRERRTFHWLYGDKSAVMAACTLCALLTLPPLLYNGAKAVASQPPGVIAAGPNQPSVQQVRIDQLRKELKTIQATLGNKKLNANERTFYENKRKTLQAELERLVAEKKSDTKKPAAEKKVDTKSLEDAKDRN